MVFYPTDNKTSTIGREHLQPIRRCIAAIKHMNEQGTPFPDADAQRLFFRVSQPGRKDPFRGPPPCHRQVGKPLHACNQRCRPLHPHDSHRARGRPVEHETTFGALAPFCGARRAPGTILRSEEHTSELQSHLNLVCRLLLEKKKIDLRSTVLTRQSVTTNTYTSMI